MQGMRRVLAGVVIGGMAGVLGLGAGAVLAQAQRLKPGLWEHTGQMQGDKQIEAAMARMQEQLARMPPEQRRQMEAMMAQGGMGMGGAPNSMRICVSAEQAARDEMPMTERNCKQTRMTRSGNTVKFAFACEGPNPTTGEGEYTFVSEREHKGKVTMQTTRNGQPHTMQMQTHARWLGADCGDIKPVGEAGRAARKP